MFSPKVIPIHHAGASPYAPPLTPSQQHAQRRCAPLNSPPPASVPVDVWRLEDDSERLL